jgi:CBS domain-containing protein
MMKENGMPKSREIMTANPVACRVTDPIVGVADTMRKQDIGSLPVVDDRDKRLVGMVTDRDIVMKIVAAGTDVRSATVKDAMTPNPVCVRQDEEVDEAVHMMSQRRVRRLPVVDTDGKLVGIISQADIATRAHQERTTGELVEAISVRG